MWTSSVVGSKKTHNRGGLLRSAQRSSTGVRWWSWISKAADMVLPSAECLSPFSLWKKELYILFHNGSSKSKDGIHFRTASENREVWSEFAPLSQHLQVWFGKRSTFPQSIDAISSPMHVFDSRSLGLQQCLMLLTSSRTYFPSITHSQSSSKPHLKIKLVLGPSKTYCKL